MSTKFAISVVDSSDVVADTTYYSFYEQVGDKTEYHAGDHSDLFVNRIIATRRAPTKTKDSEGSRHAKLMVHRQVDVLNPENVTVHKTNSIRTESSIAVGSDRLTVGRMILANVQALTGEDVSSNLTDAEVAAMPGVDLMIDGAI